MSDPGRGAALRNWLVVAALVGAGLFALLGGTYTTFDLLRLRDDLARERESIDQLKEAVDSLQKVAEAAERDPRVQERLARDQYGMIRSGEHLYRIVPGDTVTGDR